MQTYSAHRAKKVMNLEDDKSDKYDASPIRRTGKNHTATVTFSTGEESTASALAPPKISVERLSAVERE